MVLVIGIMFIPLLQRYVFYFKEKLLLGASIPADDTILTLNSWLSGRYQMRTEDFLNEKFGFRSFFVRINNQKRFSLFGKTSANDVIIGKQKVLYQRMYYDAFIGTDHKDEAIIAEQVRRYKYVQDVLQTQNKHLLFIIAPGKVSFFPEYIPDELSLQRVNPSNYEVVVNELQKNDVNYIDFRDYFIRIKDQASYPLFPRSGTHWSGYAATIVMDSLVKYIEHVMQQDIPDFELKPGTITNKDMRWTDSDIGDAMNLLVPIKNWDMYYPEINFIDQPEKKKPELLLIGDSFSQSLFKFYPYFDHLFGSQSVFWGYNRIIAWPDSLEKKYINVKTLNLEDEIRKREFIVIVSTEQNLGTFSFDFADECYELFNKKDIQTN